MKPASDFSFIQLSNSREIRGSDQPGGNFQRYVPWKDEMSEKFLDLF